MIYCYLSHIENGIFSVTFSAISLPILHIFLWNKKILGIYHIKHQNFVVNACYAYLTIQVVLSHLVRACESLRKRSTKVRIYLFHGGNQFKYNIYDIFDIVIWHYGTLPTSGIQCGGHIDYGALCGQISDMAHSVAPKSSMAVTMVTDRPWYHIGTCRSSNILKTLDGVLVVW